MEAEWTPLDIAERFCFSCSPEVACFNACCRDLNQYLTPYDILRLKRHLGMSSGEFLTTYTRQHLGSASGLPVVTLKPGDTPDRACCFVSPAGCRVYASRPTSCRTYPLARAVGRDRDSGRTREHFALIREPHCLGHGRGRTQDVQEWIRDQQLGEANRVNDLLLEIIALKNSRLPGPLDLRRQHLFRLALYDVDALRDHVFSKGLFDDAPAAPQTLEAARGDDLTLLVLGHQWLRRALFDAADSPPGPF